MSRITRFLRLLPIRSGGHPPRRVCGWNSLRQRGDDAKLDRRRVSQSPDPRPDVQGYPKGQAPGIARNAGRRDPQGRRRVSSSSPANTTGASSRAEEPHRSFPRGVVLAARGYHQLLGRPACVARAPQPHGAARSRRWAWWVISSTICASAQSRAERCRPKASRLARSGKALAERVPPLCRRSLVVGGSRQGAAPTQGPAVLITRTAFQPRRDTMSTHSENAGRNHNRTAAATFAAALAVLSSSMTPGAAQASASQEAEDRDRFRRNRQGRHAPANSDCTMRTEEEPFCCCTVSRKRCTPGRTSRSPAAADYEVHVRLARLRLVVAACSRRVSTHRRIMPGS